MLEPIEKRIEREVAKAKEQYGKYLYHYTSISALSKILKSKTFLLGNTANMNDSSEIMDFIDRILNVVSKKVDNTNPKLKESINYVKNGAAKDYPYAMCLSYGYEDASLWERYANFAEGVCIAFDIEEFYKLLFIDLIAIDHIYYDYDENQHKLVEIIKDFIEGRDTHDFDSLDSIISNITLCGVCHKHKSFISEREVRVVSLVQPENRRKVFLEKDGMFKDMEPIDLSNICSKYNINFEAMFGKIILGPRSKQSILDLQEYIRHLGYEALAERVEKSACPLR